MNINGDEGEDSGSEPGHAIQERGVGCFPVADLDVDFDGQPTNGSEYLAMIQREAAGLPFTTKADIPYAPATVDDKARAENFEEGIVLERHPALPKESWYIAFDGHFRSYRKFIRESRPALRTRYKAATSGPSTGQRPLPAGRSETEWSAFINGAKRKRIHKSAIINTDLKALNGSAVRTADDEEELANNTAPDAAAQAAEADNSDSPYTLEPEQPKHLPQEPHLSMLSTLDQETIYVALKSLNKQVFYRIRDLDGPNLLMETQPGSKTGISPRSIASPLSAHQARWIFSLLLFLDDYLPPDDLADLRNVAKTCLRIVRWQVTSQVHVFGEGQDSHMEQEEMRTSCWIIHRAISIGWGQNDLPRDAESIFARLQKEAQISA